MKSLDQIEPRIPISSAPFTIVLPGSYCLATNVAVSAGNAITIATNGVTLDLNGFTISAIAGSETDYGILLNSGLSDIAIFNGHIRGCVTNNGSGVYSGSGFIYGLIYDAIPPANVRVSNVSVSGCLYYGIWLTTGDSTLVEGCTVRTVGNYGYGIGASTVRDSVVTDCGGTAIYGTQVFNCRGESNGNIEYGIYANETAMGCYGSSISGIGVRARNAVFCTASRPGGTALQATIANGCYAAAGTNNITYKYNMP